MPHVAGAVVQPDGEPAADEAAVGQPAAAPQARADHFPRAGAGEPLPPPAPFFRRHGHRDDAGLGDMMDTDSDGEGVFMDIMGENDALIIVRAILDRVQNLMADGQQNDIGDGQQQNGDGQQQE